MSIRNTFKPTSTFVVALCGLLALSTNAIGGQQSNPVIQLQPQTGATVNKAASETMSRIRRKGFVPQAIQGLPKISAEPIAPITPPTPTTKQPAAQPTKKTPTSPTVDNSTAKAPRQTQSAIVSSQDSIIRTTIESPKFVNLNKPAVVKVGLENTGKTPVGQVEFLVALPEFTKLVSASPEPTAVNGQMLQFNLKTFSPAEKQQIQLNVIPTQRSAINIATSVRTENQQNVSVAVREPQLQAIIKGPSQTNLGEQVTHEVVVTNTGDGVATQVKIQPTFPENLVQTKQADSNLIPSIQPGKSVTVVYHSQAITPGAAEIRTAVSSDDGTEPKTAHLAMTVFEPTLQVAAIGPKVNFVDRNGIYTINLENSGKVPVTDILVALQVPEGLKITTISREANVDAEKGILRWKFAEIKAGSTEQIQMMALAEKEGDLTCNISVDSHETSEKQIYLSTKVTTRANLNVALKNNSGPVQVGGKATFSVELENDGSRKAVDVNVKIELPPSLQAVASDSQKVSITGNTISFVEPQVGPGRKVSFQFSAVGLEAGEHVVRTETLIEGSQRRVIAEDSVFVYDVAEARVSESLTPTVERK